MRFAYYAFSPESSCLILPVYHSNEEVDQITEKSETGQYYFAVSNPRFLRREEGWGVGRQPQRVC